PGARKRFLLSVSDAFDRFLGGLFASRTAAVCPSAVCRKLDGDNGRRCVRGRLFSWLRASGPGVAQGPAGGSGAACEILSAQIGHESTDRDPASLVARPLSGASRTDAEGSEPSRLTAPA